MLSWRTIAALTLILFWFVARAAIDGKFNGKEVQVEQVREVYIVPDVQKREIERANKDIIHMTATNAELGGKTIDLEAKLRDAMDSITALTSELNTRNAENDELRKELKKAIANLAFTKKQLAVCENSLQHQYLKNKYCKFKSQTLLR